MIFTTKAEYGVRLLIQLGLQGGDHPVSLKAVAEAENLPLAYLERIAALLKKQELIKATRGAHGGYLLARPAEEITMDAVVLALEGAIAPMDCFFDARERDHGPPRPGGHGRADPLQRGGHHGGRPGRARPRRPVHGLPVPRRDPRRDDRQVPAHGHERPPRGARRAADLAEG